MANLPPNAIIAFIGNHSAIPAGWSRFTSLDNKYPKGAADGFDPGDTGGAATHTHTSPSHTHTANHHTHTGYTDRFYPSPDGTSAGNRTNGDHVHGSITITATSGSAADAINYGAASNDPPYYTVIFMKATGYQPIPQNGMILSESTSRLGLTFHTASAGKYWKGADTAANPGSTGGAYTNSHDIAHGHTGSHTHTGYTSGTGDNTRGNDGNENANNNNHYHDIGLNAASDTLATNSETTGDMLGASGENIEPVYKTLNGFYNNAAAAKGVMVGDVVLWSGLLEDIPVGWVLCDGTNGTPDMRSRFLKHNASAGASVTGGSNTHSHPATTHSHSVGGTHTHPGGYTTSSGYQNNVGVGNDGYRSHYTHSHSIQGISYNSVSYTSANTTPDASDNQPPYYTVAYIQIKRVVAGGGFLACTRR